jgi:phage baseplate assembly protein W
MVFETFDATGLQRLRSLVDEALRRYEPRIEVLAVNADDSDIADGRLMVDVDYRVRQTNQTGNLVFPFYFREGGRP